MPCAVSASWGVDFVPEEDATLVARLREAGGIIAGTTYYMPDRHGNPPTGNSWNLARTPGGSSSGSAASVGARMVPAAIGESTGGSGIRPPSFCGVAAMKPTFGRISGKGMYVYSWVLDHPTVIGQTMADIALIYNCIAGPDPLDETGRTEPLELVSAELPATPPKFGRIVNYFPDLCQQVMLDQMDAAVARLRDAGAEIIDIMLFDQVDFLLTPAAVEEPPLGHGGGDNRMNSPWSVVGIPSLTFNIGLSPNGLPMGAQLAAPQLKEDAILKAGAWCESVMGRLRTPDVTYPANPGQARGRLFAPRRRRLSGQPVPCFLRRDRWVDPHCSPLSP